MDYDLAALQDLVDDPGSYNAGLATLTRDPLSMEQVKPSATPWLLQTDGESEEDYGAGGLMMISRELIYLCYVRKDKDRFPYMTAPDIRRAVLRDVHQIIDLAETRGGLTIGRVARTTEAADDPEGVWSQFRITETVTYHRTIGV